MLAGTAAEGGVPLAADSVAVAGARAVATARVAFLQPGGARSLAWLLPRGANGVAAQAVAMLPVWTPATADGDTAELRVDVRCVCDARTFLLT